jgi:hypothetical protein
VGGWDCWEEIWEGPGVTEFQGWEGVEEGIDSWYLGFFVVLVLGVGDCGFGCVV